MKLLEFTDYNSRSKAILNESWELLTEHQKIHVNAWEKRVWPLMEQINVLLEADLTADQIQQIFANAEKLSAEQETGLTALGKAGKVTAEVSSQLKQEISKLLDQAKNSEPVKNMDAQFDKLRSEIAKSVQSMPGGDKILAGVDKWKKFAEENPGKSAFIIGAMTSLLAFASGGAMSGAAIGFFLRLANNTIKGDQLSTALGKGVKTAALGAIAGAIGGALADNVEIVEPEIEGGEMQISSEIDSEDIANSSEEIENTATALEDMTVDEYKLQIAEKHAENLQRMNNIRMSPEMIQKIADNVEISGNYPDSFKASFEGTIVRGNTYLTPDELAEWKKFVNSDDPFSPRGVLGSETTEWLKNNVEAFPGSGAATDAAADTATAASGDTAADTATDAGTDTGSEAPSADSPDAATSETVTFQGGSGVEYDRAKLVQAAKDAMANSDGPEYLDGEIKQAILDEMYKQAEAEGTAPDFMIGDEVGLWIDAGMNNGEGPFAELQDSEITNESRYYDIDEEDLVDQLWEEFELYEKGINEGPVGDAAKNFAKSVGGAAAAGAKKVGQGIAGAVKKGAQKGAQAVKTGAQAAGKELGQKVTVRKLNRLWKKMGSPTDTGSIANLLSDVGMSDEQIGTVGQENNVELKVDKSQQQTQQQPQQQSQQSASNVDVETLAKQINSLPPYGKKKIKDELKKQLKK